MKTILDLMLALLLTGCATITPDRLTDAGSKAHAVCLEGSGPPLSGSGHIASGKADKDFKGKISIGPDCSVEIVSE